MSEGPSHEAQPEEATDSVDYERVWGVRRGHLICQAPAARLGWLKWWWFRC